MSAGRSSGVVPPKQRRTQANVERILAAVAELAAQRPYSEISVMEICELAEVSSSSFYARFGSKEALLAAAFDQLVAEAHSRLGDLVAGLDLDEADPRTIIGLVLAEYIHFMRANTSILRSVEQDPVLVERHWRLTSEVNGVLAEVLEVVYGTDDEEFGRRARIGIRIVGTAAMRAVGVPVRFGDRLGLDDDELAEELGEMLAAYLDRAAQPG